MLGIIGGTGLTALENLLNNNYMLEKNYCFLGFPDSKRNGDFICEQINESIAEINAAKIGYTIDDVFTMATIILLIKI